MMRRYCLILLFACCARFAPVAQSTDTVKSLAAVTLEFEHATTSTAKSVTGTTSTVRSLAAATLEFEHATTGTKSVITNTTGTARSLDAVTLEFEHANTGTSSTATNAIELPVNPDRPANLPPARIPQIYDLLTDPQIPRYDFAPPLSVSDVIYLIRCCNFILDESNRDYVQIDPLKLDLLLGSILNYARLLDNRYSTLRRYSWTQLGRTKISRSTEDTDTIELNPPISGVSAIAVSVTGADAEILELRAWNAARIEFTLAPDRTVLLRDRPSREVIFFNRQVSIAEIQVRVRTLDPDQSATLYFEAGIAGVPEHMKYAIRELKLARESIKTANYPEARNYLRNAWRNILSFRTQQNI